MSLVPAMITCDASDPVELGRWWAEQTGGRVTEENDGWLVVVEIAGGPRLAFQKVESPTPGKNRVHVDLETSEDLDAVAARLEAAGAQLVEEHVEDGFRWIVLNDPAGNAFCISGAY